MARVSLRDTPLAGPEFLCEVMATVMECDFLPRITESHGGGLIEREGSLARLMTELSVGSFQPDSQGALPASRKASIVRELSIDNLSRLDLEFGDGDLELALERGDWFLPEMREAVYQSFVAYQREWVLTRMLEAAPARNRGNSAGLNGALRLGEKDDPLSVPSGKILAELSKLRRALVEAKSWKSERMWLVVPLEFFTALARTDLAKVVLNGPPMSVDGELPNSIMGFRVYVTGSPPFEGAPGSGGFPILAGNRDAFVYSGALIESEIVSDSGSEFFRLKAAHGGEAVRAEGLAAAWWSMGFDGE